MSRKMIDYKVEDGKIVSIDGYEVGGGAYKIAPLTVTENGVYDSEFEAYKPVVVSVPQTAESGTVKALLDATKSTQYLFDSYKGTSIDGLISYSDTANVTAMVNMFQNAYDLTSIPALDTSKVKDMSGMFFGCRSLTAIPVLDASNVTNMVNIFYNCRSVTSIGLFGFRYSVYIADTALEHDAIVAFLNQAGTAYDSFQKITIGSTKLALLSDAEKAIATNKGWTLA